MLEDFFELTPDRVMIALEKEGFAPTGHWQVLNSLENRVFDFKLDTDEHIVVKFYRPGRWSPEQILEEHSFLKDLVAAEIPAVQPLTLKNGSTTATDNGIHFAVWPRTGGRVPDELNDDELLMLGRFLGRLHNAGDRTRFEHRIRFDSTTFGMLPLQYLEENGFLPDSIAGEYREAVELICAYYDQHSPEIPTTRIHGDCHPGNLLRGENGFFFLDFDDSMNGPVVQDLWLMVPGRDQEAVRQREIMLEGYRVFRPFENHWLGLVESMRALRYVHYSSWIARRLSDPIFPHTFPDFGTRDYWQEELMELRDIGERLLAGGGDGRAIGERRGPSQVQEEELTNKDFFWDWEGDS